MNDFVLEQRLHSISIPGYLTYRFDPALPKPGVHPLMTPSGTVVSGWEMSDHVWHRGLWFTIKLINGSNFWEENAPYGIQKSAAIPTARLLGPMHARIEHTLIWTSDATGDVISETRTIDIRQDDHGIRTIDWSTRLTMLKDLLLDRTPYTTWGGYGGMSFRGSRELHDAAFLLPSGDEKPALVGEPHPWSLLQASVDGGLKRRVSVGLIDHPSNPRSPAPWYSKTAGGFVFANAAFLFHEPMSVTRGSTLAMKYRIHLRDGVWPAGEFARLADAFRQL